MSFASVQPVAAARSPLAASQIPATPGPSFAEQLRAAGRGQLVDNAQRAAEQFVAGAFIQPMLAIARETSTASSGPFAPGDAERRFSPLLDQHLADNVVEGSSFPLVTHVREHLLQNVVQQGGARPGGIDVTT